MGIFYSKPKESNKHIENLKYYDSNDRELLINYDYLKNIYQKMIKKYWMIF